MYYILLFITLLDVKYMEMLENIRHIEKGGDRLYVCPYSSCVTLSTLSSNVVINSLSVQITLQSSGEATLSIVM